MRTGVLLRWVAHPLTVAATAVLLVNDHVLKQAWPGVVTGKLSDFAGLVVAPPVLGLLLGLVLADRIGAAAAVLLVGAGFTWVKVAAAGSEAASAAWSVVAGPSLIRADPTDLIALPALGIAWWAWRRAAAAEPSDRQAVRSRVILAAPFAVLAITATSAPADTLPSVDSVRTGDDATVLIEVDGQTFVSRSGVDGWTLVSSGLLADHPRRVEACVPDDAAHCFRAHGRDSGDHALGVDETTDGGATWRTAWEVPAGRWPFVRAQHPYADAVAPSSQVASVDIAVRTVFDGYEVIVANGAEGLAIRGVDGTWRRVAVVTATGLEIRPAPLTAFGRGIGVEVTKAVLIILLALAVGMAVAEVRARARVRRRFFPVAVPLGFFIPAAGMVIGAVDFFSGPSGTTTGLVLALVLLAPAAVLALSQRVLGRSRTAVVVGAAVVTGLAFTAPILGWTAGVPQDRGLAIDLGLILAGAGLLGAVAAGWWAGSDPSGLRDGEAG